MQSLEAILSLMFLVSVVSFLLVSLEGQKLDDSLYRVQLAEDAWRVLYLRGDFQDFSDSKRPVLESDLAAIGSETGLCIFMGGIQFTNCRDGQEHDITASLTKTLVYYDADQPQASRPEAYTFSIAK